MSLLSLTGLFSPHGSRNTYSPLLITAFLLSAASHLPEDASSQVQYWRARMTALHLLKCFLPNHGRRMHISFFVYCLFIRKLTYEFTAETACIIQLRRLRLPTLVLVVYIILSTPINGFMPMPCIPIASREDPFWNLTAGRRETIPRKASTPEWLHGESQFIQTYSTTHFLPYL